MRGAHEMHKHHMRKRLAGLIAVLMLAAGITAASALAAARSAHGHDEKQPARVELTYTKWFAPGFPTWFGVVGGDSPGPSAGPALRQTADGPSRSFRLRAGSMVVGRTPAESFTAPVEG